MALLDFIFAMFEYIASWAIGLLILSTIITFPILFYTIVLVFKNICVTFDSVASNPGPWCIMALMLCHFVWCMVELWPGGQKYLDNMVDDIMMGPHAVLVTITNIADTVKTALLKLKELDAGFKDMAKHKDDHARIYRKMDENYSETMAKQKAMETTIASLNDTIARLVERLNVSPDSYSRKAVAADFAPIFLPMPKSSIPSSSLPRAPKMANALVQTTSNYTSSGTSMDFEPKESKPSTLGLSSIVGISTTPVEPKALVLSINVANGISVAPSGPVGIPLGLSQVVTLHESTPTGDLVLIEHERQRQIRDLVTSILCSMTMQIRPAKRHGPIYVVNVKTGRLSPAAQEAIRHLQATMNYALHLRNKPRVAQIDKLEKELVNVMKKAEAHMEAADEQLKRSRDDAKHFEDIVDSFVRMAELRRTNMKTVEALQKQALDDLAAKETELATCQENLAQAYDRIKQYKSQLAEAVEINHHWEKCFYGQAAGMAQDDAQVDENLDDYDADLAKFLLEFGQASNLPTGDESMLNEDEAANLEATKSATTGHGAADMFLAVVSESPASGITSETVPVDTVEDLQDAAKPPTSNKGNAQVYDLGPQEPKTDSTQKLSISALSNSKYAPKQKTPSTKDQASFYNPIDADPHGNALMTSSVDFRASVGEMLKELFCEVCKAMFQVPYETEYTVPGKAPKEIILWDKHEQDYHSDCRFCQETVSCFYDEAAQKYDLSEHYKVCPSKGNGKRPSPGSSMQSSRYASSQGSSNKASSSNSGMGSSRYASNLNILSQANKSSSSGRVICYCTNCGKGITNMTDFHNNHQIPCKDKARANGTVNAFDRATGKPVAGSSTPSKPSTGASASHSATPRGSMPTFSKPTTPSTPQGRARAVPPTRGLMSSKWGNGADVTKS